MLGSRRLLFVFLFFQFVSLSGYSQQLGSTGLRNLDGKPVKLSSLHKKLTAIVFLSPECPLSENYTLVLNRLQQQFHESTEVVGVFPGKSYSVEEYVAFSKKYKIRFLLLTDSAKKLSGQLNATVTPEVFLVDRNNNLVYSGAIDNWVVDLGKKRAAATEHYLAAAISACNKNEPIIVPHTKAVGCFINDL